MSGGRQREVEDEQARPQELLGALEALSDPAARSTAKQLVQAVMQLHGAGLTDLLAIVEEAGSQPADTLLPRFAANPKVSGLLLLHDLHPEDLATRARKAVDHLRPHLGVRGVRVELAGVDDNVVRVSVTASGQKTQRPPAAELRREIENAVLALAPDVVDLVIDGLETTSAASEVYVPLVKVVGRRRTSEPVSAVGD